MTSFATLSVLSVSLYECINRVRSELESRRCTYIAFKNHPFMRYRNPCSAVLLKKVSLKHGKTKLVPKKEYPYRSVVKSLNVLLQRPNILEKLDLWKQRSVPDGLLTDVYDGKIWKEFMMINDEPFLSGETTYGFMLNVDWFKPFKRTQYKVGAIYLVVLNFPRSERFLRENLILVGIIPGPGEPNYVMNTYLAPMIKDLQDLWKGVEMKLLTVISLYVQLCSVLGVTYLLTKNYVGLEDLDQPETVIGALNCLRDLAFISLTLTLTETCGQNVLTLITAKMLKRLKVLQL